MKRLSWITLIAPIIALLLAASAGASTGDINTLPGVHPVSSTVLKPSRDAEVVLDSAKVTILSDGSTVFEGSITPPLDAGPLAFVYRADVATGEYWTIEIPYVEDDADISATMDTGSISPDSLEGNYRSRAYVRNYDPAFQKLTETRNRVDWYVDPYNTMSLMDFYWEPWAANPVPLPPPFNTHWHVYSDYHKYGPYYNPYPTDITLEVWANFWNQDWGTSAYTYVQTYDKQTVHLDGTSNVVWWDHQNGEDSLLLWGSISHSYGF